MAKRIHRGQTPGDPRTQNVSAAPQQTGSERKPDLPTPAKSPLEEGGVQLSPPLIVRQGRVRKA